MLNNITVKNHSYFNNKFFGKWAWLYDCEKYFLFPIRRKAAKLLDLKFLQTVLDVATGTGAQAYEFAKLGYNVIGVDLSPEMLLQAKKKLRPSLNLKFVEADGTNLPFKDNSFDASSISLGLHDMPFNIGTQVLKEMKRVTKGNGKILIVDYMEPKKNIIARFTHPLINLYETEHYNGFIQKGLDSYLRHVGLSTITTDNFLGVLQTVIVKNIK